MKNQNYVISIIVCTYNHENTIEKCLSSLVNQILNVEYEIIIGDDESKDKTSKICQEFKANHRNIKYLKRDKNIGMINNFMDLISESKGEFIAQCSGDDFWIDDYKLQKQYDFLRQNSNYGMVHTDYKILYRNELRKSTPPIQTQNVFDALLSENFINPTTCFFRKKILLEAIKNEVINSKTVMEDYNLVLYTAEKYKIGYLNDITTVYLKNENSLSNFTNQAEKLNFINEIIKVQIKFAISNGKIGLIKDRIKRHYNHMIYESFLGKANFNKLTGISNLIKINALSFFFIKYYLLHLFPFKYLKQKFIREKHN